MRGILCLGMVFCAPLFAQQIFNSCVENEAADISVTLPSAFNTANTALPNPFLMMSGTDMTTKEQWKQRRQELLRLLERTCYGTKPAKPASVTGTVSDKSISVNAGGGSFSVSVTMPTSGSKPYPLVIRYDNSGVPAANFTGNGVAVANLTTANVGGGTRTAKSGAFYTANPNSKSTGHLAAWAWGVSRIIDVIEADPDNLFDPTKIGVTGCSRDGKGAFVAGVLDQRVALTMPMESGTGGMASMRVAYNNRDQSGGTNGSQSPSAAYGEQPWLGDDFSAFQNSPNNLPTDMHAAIALVAPRGFLAVYKTASSAGQWLNVPGSHISAVAAAEVYKALGVGGNFGWLNTGTESHCAWPSSYNNTVKDFIDIYLHRTKTPAAAPLLTENNRPSTTNYINWATPALSGNLTIGGGCGTATPSSSSSGGAQSSSSSAEPPATDCITLPANPNPPADPYGTCFKHTDNKCYVCDDSHQADPSVAPNCRSAWIWDGNNVDTEGNIGMWYREVPCSAQDEPSSSSSGETPGGSSSSSLGDATPILAGNAPLTHFSVRVLGGKTLLIEANSPASVEIFDLKGNKAAKLSVQSGSQKVDLALPNGVYFAKARGLKSVRFVLK